MHIACWKNKVTKNTVRVYNVYWFSTATIATRTLLGVISYVHRPSLPNSVSQQHTNWFLYSSLCFGWVWLDSSPYLSKYCVGNFTYVCPITRQPTVKFHMLYLSDVSANTDIAFEYLLQKSQFILQLNENLISEFSKLCADIHDSWHIVWHQVQPCKL
jgi:hypothetical protein